VPFGGSALAGAVEASGSEAVVCAPPLLLIVTPDATWADVDVAPVVVVPALFDVEPAPVVAVDEEPVPVVDGAADPVDDSPDDVKPAELVDDDSEDVPDVSAPANP
jgi:hypothetical protein